MIIYLGTTVWGIDFDCKLLRIDCPCKPGSDCGWLLQMVVIPHGCIIITHGYIVVIVVVVVIVVIAVIASCSCGWLNQLPPLSWLLMWLFCLVLVVAVNDSCYCSCFWPLCPCFPLFHGCFPCSCLCSSLANWFYCCQSHSSVMDVAASTALQNSCDCFAAMDGCSNDVCIIIFSGWFNIEFDH